MSFRLFIYYCALCGGWSAFGGWILGRVLAPTDDTKAILTSGVQGLFLGLFVAFGLGLVDALWNLSLRQFGQIFLRVGTGVFVGAVGGFMGGSVGQLLYENLGRLSVFYVFGWTMTGFLIGMSIGVFEVLVSAIRQQDLGFAIKKIMKATVGGTVGGILGGTLSLLLRLAWTSIFHDKPAKELWSPSSMGFVALGMCIGLLIGLAQVILKEAWIKVEAGFRPGREMILSKEKTSVGRAEGSDIALFGDMDAEKLHAHIVMSGNRYYLEDVGTPGGTFINDQRIAGRTPLSSGDLIRCGKSLLRFRERRKNTASTNGK